MAHARSRRARRFRSLYLAAWRWHCYAGLVLAPLLFVLTSTGTLYLFHNEIDAFLYADLIQVEGGGPSLPLSAQEHSIRQAFPDARISRYATPREAMVASEWSVVDKGGQRLSVFVNPRTAAVTGAVASSARFSHVVRDLHGELMVGFIGELIVEAAASSTLLLLLTGAVLWWPRIRKRWRGFSLRGSASMRARLKELHAVPALWNAAIVVFLIMSGLPWSGFWGRNLARLGTLDVVAPILKPTPNFAEFAILDGHPNREELPWSIRNAQFMTRPVLLTKTYPTSNHKALSIDDVAMIATQRGLSRPGLRIFYPQDPGGTFTLNFIPDRAQGQRTLRVDARSGAVVLDLGWDEYSPLGKLVELGVMIHMGRQFGSMNRVVLALSSLVLLLTLATAMRMWWTRRPKRRSPASTSDLGDEALGGMIWVPIVFAMVFPLGGASLLLFVIADNVIAPAFGWRQLSSR
ncbi:MAG: PepSY domain-containing protein [Myxococcota bacterium]